MDEILTTRQAAAYIKKPIAWVREHVQELGGSSPGPKVTIEKPQPTIVGNGWKWKPPHQAILP